MLKKMKDLKSFSSCKSHGFQGLNFEGQNISTPSMDTKEITADLALGGPPIKQAFVTILLEKTTATKN